MYSICELISIWAQLLNREQTRLELVLVPATAAPSKNGMDTGPVSMAPAYVIYSETTDVWINVRPYTLPIYIPSG